MKFWKWLRDFLRENVIVILLVFTAWFKLLRVDAIMFDETKGLSVIFFVAFTAASALLIHSIAFVFKGKTRDWVALTISAILSLIIWADMVYYRFFGSLIKMETLSIAGQTTGVGDSVIALLSLSDVIFFVDILIIGCFLIFGKKRAERDKSLGERFSTCILITIVSLLPISAILWRDRSDQLKNFIYSNFDINTIEFRYGLVGAHGISTFRSVMTAMERLDEAEKEVATNWISANAVGQADNQFTAVAKGKNVFLIQMESMQSFVIGRKYQDVELTPNLNKLVSSSYYFPNGQSVIGGGRTSDSDFASNTSIYPLKDASAFVQYGKDDFSSLPKALKNEGYTVNAYHAFKRDFWNRNVAFNSLGFDHFFSGGEYQKGDTVGMGLNDESFYEQTFDKLVLNADRPAFNYLISLSSHHPFERNPLVEEISTEGQDFDEQTHYYFEAIHYADKSLGIFLEGLKEKGIYDDSLIIIYGDHPAKIGNYSDPLVKKMLGELTSAELAAIPFIYKLPVQNEGFALNHETSQLDIMPTVLNLVGAKTNYPMFGGDALTGEKKPIKVKDAKYYSDLMIRFNLFEEFTNK